jgi:hypothetical protein
LLLALGAAPLFVFGFGIMLVEFSDFAIEQIV